MVMEWVSLFCVLVFKKEIGGMGAWRVRSVFFVCFQACWMIHFFSFVKASAPSLQAMHGSYLLTTYRLLNRNELLTIYPFPLFSEDVRTGLGNIGMVLTIRDGLLGISTEATSGKRTNVSLQKCPCVGLNIGHLLVIEHDSNTEKKT